MDPGGGRVREPGLQVLLFILLPTPTLKARELSKEKELSGHISLLSQGDHPKVQRASQAKNKQQQQQTCLKVTLKSWRQVRSLSLGNGRSPLGRGPLFGKI